MAVSRRRWIGTTGAAIVVAGLPRAAGAARAEAPPLPAPIPADSFRERQAKLRAGAKTRGLDALVVTPSTNLAYAANLAIGRSERLTALFLLTDGPAVLVTPSFEEANHRREAVVEEVRTWKEEEDPYAMAGKILSGRKRIGMEGTTAFSTARRLSSATGVEPEDATPLFDSLRMIKSPEEQGLMREAGRRTSLAITATHKRIRRGMSERQVADILGQEFSNLGVEGGGLVQFGPSSAFPHGAPALRELARGDVVLIDCGCEVHGYASDVTRTAVLGPPSSELRKVYDTVDRAQVAGIGALKAGAAPEDVDRTARRVIEDAGYGEFFTHRLGHGIGMDGHEHPYLVRGNKTPLVAGNTVTVEPGIYMPGKFGVRIEDDYAVGETGPVSLSVRTIELEVLGG